MLDQTQLISWQGWLLKTKWQQPWELFMRPGRLGSSLRLAATWKGVIFLHVPMLQQTSLHHCGPSHGHSRNMAHCRLPSRPWPGEDRRRWWWPARTSPSWPGKQILHICWCPRPTQKAVAGSCPGLCWGHTLTAPWLGDRRPRNVWWHLPAFAQYPQHFEGLLLSPTVGAPCSILGSKLSFYFSRLVSMPNSRFPVWMHPGRTAACRKQLSFTSPLGPGKSHGLLGYGATLSNLCSSRTGHSLNCHLFVGCWVK